MRQSHIAPTRRKKVDRTDITVIILAANIGYGMKSYGPKALLNINPHETLLEYQLNLVQTSFPHADVVLVVGFLADKVIKHCPDGVRIVENQLFERTNEVEQLRLALNCTLTDNVLIIKDDIAFNEDTLCNITRDQSCIIFDTKNQIDEYNVGVTVVGEYATIFAYEIPHKWCHIVYLTKKDLDIMKNICSKRENAQMYAHEALNIMLERTGKIKAIEPTNMEIIKIDTSKQLFQLQET